MSVQNIVDKILAQAEAEVESITRRTDRELDRLTSGLEREQGDLMETARKRMEGQAREIRARHVSSARLEARKRILREKEMIVDEVYAEVKQRLLALPDDEYLDLLKGLAAKYGTAGDMTITLSPTDLARFKDRLSRWEAEVADELKKREIPGSVSISAGTRDIVGGIVISEGRTELNLSLDMILSEMRYLLEIEVTRILFGD